VDVTTQRQERLTNLTSTEFQERLQARSAFLNRIGEVVKEAVVDEAIEDWEYPSVEQALGAFAAVIHGVPLMLGSPSSHRS
jgi:hypothetical protein